LPTTKADFGRTVLQLNTCGSNDHFAMKHGEQGSMLTIAESFRKYYNFALVRTTSFGVNFNKDGTARPQIGVWQYLQRGSVPNIKRRLQEIKYGKHLPHQ
jgi:hypothetical protein